MEKIRNILIISLLALFFNLSLVNADITTCEYTFDVRDDLIITFDEAGTPDINQEFYETYRTPWILNYYYNNTSGKIKATQNLKDSQLKELYGSCPSSIYACKYEESAVETGYIKGLFTDEAAGFGYSVVNQVFLYYSEGNFNDAHDAVRWGVGAGCEPVVFGMCGEGDCCSEQQDAAEHNGKRAF